MHFDQAELVVDLASDQFCDLHHQVWVTEEGTSCVSLTSETFGLVESDEDPEPAELPPPAADRGAPTSEPLTFQSILKSGLELFLVLNILCLIPILFSVLFNVEGFFIHRG